MEWQLQHAKNRLSEVIKMATDEGPQTVTVRGKRVVMVLSAEAYDELIKGAGEIAKPKMSLVEFLLSGPKWDDDFVEMVNDRDKTPPRDIEW